ncbi:MAG: DinB family protein [Dehalococcoidia bacterium]
MRPIREAGGDPAFLRKALGEAAGEIRRILEAFPRSLLLEPGSGRDEDWNLLAIAVHLRDCERGFGQQIEAFFRHDHARLRHVDTDDIPLATAAALEDEELVLDELRYLRRSTTYLLWDLYPSDWERTAEHPYLGPVTLLETARRMYVHDLEHLWQARRIAESLASTPHRQRRRR